MTPGADGGFEVLLRTHPEGFRQDRQIIYRAFDGQGAPLGDDVTIDVPRVQGSNIAAARTGADEIAVLRGVTQREGRMDFDDLSVFTLARYGTDGTLRQPFAEVLSIDPTNSDSVQTSITGLTGTPDGSLTAQVTVNRIFFEFGTDQLLPYTFSIAPGGEAGRHVLQETIDPGRKPGRPLTLVDSLEQEDGSALYLATHTLRSTTGIAVTQADADGVVQDTQIQVLPLSAGAVIGPRFVSDSDGLSVTWFDAQGRLFLRTLDVELGGAPLPDDTTGEAVRTRGSPLDDNAYLAGYNDVYNAYRGDDTVDAGAGHDRILGGAGDDLIRGGTGGDRLDGGIGADTLIGGPGGDVFVVDDIGDRVLESRTWAGDDHVISSVDFRMGRSHIETLTLTDDAVLGAGNGLANEIRGNSADNVLDGGKNNDTLRGGAGNDTYLVRGPDDWVIEGAGQGTADTVKAFRAYELTANVENLHLQTMRNAAGEGVAGIDGIGNNLDNIIVGNPL